MNAEENRFVPTGVSVWELGTDSDFKAKATSDFEKRSQAGILQTEDDKILAEYERSDVTFVVATPLIWPDPHKGTKSQSKSRWINEHKARDIWKDVRVIDGADLQDWLEFTPSVSLKFAPELGVAPEAGLQTAEDAWQEWSYLTYPPLSEALVVAGREEQEQELINRLLGPASLFTVRGDSPREAVGFVLAAVRRVDPEEQQKLIAPLIISDDETVAGRIRPGKNLIVVLKQAKGNVSSYLTSQGSHMIVPEGHDARAERNVIVLTRPAHRQFTQALVGLGLSEDEAERSARESGLSVTVLQRRRAQASFELPAWSSASNAVALVPALLAGRWNDRSLADCDILTALAGAGDYNQFLQSLQPFQSIDEPPVRHIEEMWTLTAPVDAFQLLARHITQENLARFESTFRAVFGRIDPKVELPLDQWIYQDINGESGHSAWLRIGMAESLLLIAERGIGAQLMCISSPNKFAERVVQGIAGLNDDWRMLASLRDQYPRLMETAPNPLLDSLEHLLEAKPDDVRRLFAEGGFGTSPMHAGLLWGLEILAWSPQYLARVALILARLARIDPGGRWTNRPINSLNQIFLWWDPGTYAAMERRLAVIDLILEREPEVGWSLLAKLLPSVLPAISHPTEKPRWRDFGSLPDDAVTPQGQAQYLSSIVSRALDHVGHNPGRWNVILESLRPFTPAQQTGLWKLLGSIIKQQLPDPKRPSSGR